MKRAIVAHLRDFVAILALASIAVGVGAYILTNQRLRFPVIEAKPFNVKADFENARGVMPGQGQTVRVAGIRVGDVSGVELDEGRAIVTMALDRKYEDFVRADASALLRPRTGLKDMFVALDPGTSQAPAVAENAVIPARNTAPDNNPDETLEALDSDTRAYLRVLLAGAGKGLEGRAGDLREVFRRLGPLHRHLAVLNREVRKRRRNLARLVHNYGSTIGELAKKDRELSELVVSSREVFGALASEDENISLALSRLPSALDQAERTLTKVDTLGGTMGPAFEALRPAVRRIDTTNRQVRPFAEEAAPILRDRVRPFVRDARPFVRELKPAARDLEQASPDLKESFHQLNRFFNMAAYNPGGAEPLTGDFEQDLARDEGMLFWLGWVSQNTVSLFNTADASGPFRRIILSATCTTLKGLVDEEPVLGSLSGIDRVLADPGLCPAE